MNQKKIAVVCPNRALFIPFLKKYKGKKFPVCVCSVEDIAGHRFHQVYVSNSIFLMPYKEFKKIMLVLRSRIVIPKYLLKKSNLKPKK